MAFAFEKPRDPNRLDRSLYTSGLVGIKGGGWNRRDAVLTILLDRQGAKVRIEDRGSRIED